MAEVWSCSYPHTSLRLQPKHQVAHQGGGGGHPGGSQSITVGWHVTRNGLEFADSVLHFGLSKD